MLTQCYEGQGRNQGIQEPECIEIIRRLIAFQLSNSSHFSNDLGLDSLDTVEVVMAIEEVKSKGAPVMLTGADSIIGV